MAKGGYQRRRLEQKKQQERRARKRARRNKTILTWLVGLGIAGVIAMVLVIVLTGGDEDLASQPSPTPSAPASPGACTTPGPQTTGQKTFSSPPCMTIDESKDYRATIKTSMGTIEVDLLEQKAPKTVNNFVFLAQNEFYNESIFHRVIPDFGQPGSDMVQGGDAVNRDGTGDPGYKFEDENPEPFAEPGLLAMANSGPGTNGSQFFFLDGPVSHLNAEGQCPGPSACHTVFGKVTKGLDVIDKIAHVQKGEGDKPAVDVVLESVTITEG